MYTEDEYKEWSKMNAAESMKERDKGAWMNGEIGFYRGPLGQNLICDDADCVVELGTI